MKMNRGAVLAMCNIGTSSLDRYMADGFFPMPTDTGLWDSEHINLWVNSHGKGTLNSTYGRNNYGNVWPTWADLFYEESTDEDDFIKASNRQKDLDSAVKEAKTKANKQDEKNTSGAVNLHYVTERLRDIDNMDQVKDFYNECVYNMGINALRNGRGV